MQTQKEQNLLFLKGMESNALVKLLPEGGVSECHSGFHPECELENDIQLEAMRTKLSVLFLLGSRVHP